MAERRLKAVRFSEQMIKSIITDGFLSKPDPESERLPADALLVASNYNGTSLDIVFWHESFPLLIEGENPPSLALRYKAT